MPTNRKVYAIVMEHGQVYSGALKFTISDDEDMLHLSEEIGKMQKPPLPGHRILIWLPHKTLALGYSAPEDLRTRLARRKLSDIAKRAEPDQTVESIVEMSPCQPDVQVKMTHIIVDIQPPVGRTRNRTSPEKEAKLDDFVAVLAKRYAALVDDGKSLSDNARFMSYNDHQGKKYPILDGRYNAAGDIQTIAPPIELFHPVFARFRAKLADTEAYVPEEIVRDTASLMRSSSAIQVSEHQPRTQDSRTLLSKILKDPFLQAFNWDQTSADYIALCGETTVHETAAVVIVEENSELGAGGLEPSVQGSFSYIEFWADETHRQIREGCCCPCFVVGLAGPWLIIAGAVFTSKVIVQRLTDYVWLGNSRVNDNDHVLRVARILYSLQVSIQALQMYYKDLKPQPLEKNKPHPRFFPSITSYRCDSKNVNFTYCSPLELNDTCVIFLATLDAEEGQKVVVKFVSHYGEEAHRILAQLQLAPELLYCGPIGGYDVSYGKLQMVVMEYIQGQTLAYGELLPRDVKNAVEKGLGELHSRGIVYGDLRRQNIMIADAAGQDNEENIGNRVRFIDFDWAGKVGEVRYPLHLSSCISEASGGLEYDLIQKDHDTNMLNVL